MITWVRSGNFSLRQNLNESGVDISSPDLLEAWKYHNLNIVQKPPHANRCATMLSDWTV
jgi:hypothetical protein